MPRKKREVEVLPTIWRIPDDLWNLVKQELDQYDPPKHFGRKRIDQREALDAIIFGMHTGCPSNHFAEQRLRYIGNCLS